MTLGMVCLHGLHNKLMKRHLTHPYDRRMLGDPFSGFQQTGRCVNLLLVRSIFTMPLHPRREDALHHVPAVCGTLSEMFAGQTGGGKCYSLYHRLAPNVHVAVLRRFARDCKQLRLFDLLSVASVNPFERRLAHQHTIEGVVELLRVGDVHAANDNAWAQKIRQGAHLIEPWQFRQLLSCSHDPSWCELQAAVVCAAALRHVHKNAATSRRQCRPLSRRSLGLRGGLRELAALRFLDGRRRWTCRDDVTP